MALSDVRTDECLLLGAKRTSLIHDFVSAHDPEQTSSRARQSGLNRSTAARKLLMGGRRTFELD